MWVCIQIGLLVVAGIAGAIGWVTQGFFHGLCYSIVIFSIGEVIAALIIEMTCHLPEKSDAPHRLPSNEEELDALRAELNREAEQGSEPDS